MFRLQPIFELVSIATAPGLPVFVRSIYHLLLVHKRQLMVIEVGKQLFPRNWAKAAESGKVEPDTRSASLTCSVAGPDAVLSPVAGVALCRSAHWRIKLWSLVARARTREPPVRSLVLENSSRYDFTACDFLLEGGWQPGDLRQDSRFGAAKILPDRRAVATAYVP